MAYTFHAMNYGPKPWQRVLVGEPNSGATVGAAGTKPAFVYVPGGGWGLRDPIVVTRDYAGTEPFMKALIEPGGTYENAYRVFVPFVASNSCNAPRGSAHEVPTWATNVSYDKGDYVVWQGVKYQAAYDMAAASDQPMPFSTIETTVAASPAPTVSSFQTDHTISTTLDGFGDDNGLLIMQNGEQALVATTTRTSGKALVGVAGGGLDTAPTAGDEIKILCPSWVEMLESDAGDGRLGNRGDGSAAYGGQSVADINRLIGWMRNNKSMLAIQPQKIALMGSSAGGQAAGCAAYSDAGNFGAKRHHTSASPFVSQVPTKPNALILGITQSQAERGAAVNGAGYTQQSQYLGFMASLYGDARLGTSSAWQAYPDDKKKALDPYDAASRSGQVMPTCLVYTLDNGYDDTRTEDEVFNGSTTLAPEIHHSLHGRYYFDKLRSTAAAGGWGNVTSRLILKGDSNSEIRSYYEFSGLTNEGTEGQHYEKEVPSGSTTRGDIIGNYIMEFLDSVL